MSIAILSREVEIVEGQSIGHSSGEFDHQVAKRTVCISCTTGSQHSEFILESGLSGPPLLM